MAKKPMSTLTKMKLIYCGEIMLFAIAFLVIGILKITDVWKVREKTILVFNFLTLAGGLWMIIDFIWVLVSKKRRAKNSLVDKSTLLPLGIFLVTFDIICLTVAHDFEANYSLYRFGVSGVFLYVAVIYAFQSIYHWYRPLPSIYEAVEQAEKEDDDQNKAEPTKNNENNVENHQESKDNQIKEEEK